MLIEIVWSNMSNTIQYNTTVFLERLTKNKSYSKTLYNVSSVTIVFQP